MINYEAHARLWHAAALCAIAGFVDAIGYIDLGHVFTANMTGNTVLLGVALMNGDWIVLSYAATIAAFALGVITSTLLKLGHLPLPAQFLIGGAVLLCVVILQPTAFVALSLLAFAMGLQGGAISTFSGIRLPTVVVTSTLVNLVDGLVRRQLAQSDASTPSSGHLHHLLAAWLAYGAGGAAAVLARKHPSPCSHRSVLALRDSRRWSAERPEGMMQRLVHTSCLAMRSKIDP